MLEVTYATSVKCIILDYVTTMQKTSKYHNLLSNITTWKIFHLDDRPYYVILGYVRLYKVNTE